MIGFPKDPNVERPRNEFGLTMEELRGFVAVVVRMHLAGKPIQARIDLRPAHGIMWGSVTVRLTEQTRIGDPLREKVFCHIIDLSEYDFRMRGGLDAVLALIRYRLDSAVAGITDSVAKEERR